MNTSIKPTRLDRSVDATDHILGPADAPLTLVEYGSYACAHCRAANERIADVRDEFSDQLRYVFRHKPITGSDLARRAAALVERSLDHDQFWKAHMALMTRSSELTEDDLNAIEKEYGLPATEEALSLAQARVQNDEQSALQSGVHFTPTFFINQRRYDGAWDSAAFIEALRGSMAHRLRSMALDFVGWGPSAGFMLLLASVIAVLATNSRLGADFTQMWHQGLGWVLAEKRFELSVLHWINDGLLTVFFLLVGLEIKREFTVGSLASRKAAALPVAAALGGMLVPALLYRLIIPSGPLSHGWGVPMATDTAFAIALIATLGERVPVDLRIFLTAAAIVDDIGAILVVAFFYSDALQPHYFLAAGGIICALALLNQWRVYRVMPYAVLGLALWYFVHETGLHATLAGVMLALFIPTRPPAKLRALVAQASAIAATAVPPKDEVLRHGLPLPALHALDAIHDRIESPAARLLRRIEPWSSYFILPIFALANAGVVIDARAFHGHGQIITAIVAALCIGKPLGLISVSMLAVRFGVATKPDAYSWTQVAGAGLLAGIGFTMSLFIAGQAFPQPSDFAAAKIAVFIASIICACLGGIALWRAGAASA